MVYMNTNQEHFIESNAWILKHPDIKRLRPIVKASPLSFALKIWENIPEGGATLQELAHRLDANGNTVAITTRALERAGLVKRSKNPENARQTLVEKQGK